MTIINIVSGFHGTGIQVLYIHFAIMDKFPVQSEVTNFPLPLPSDCVLATGDSVQSDNTLSPGEANTTPLTPEMIEFYIQSKWI